MLLYFLSLPDYLQTTHLHELIITNLTCTLLLQTLPVRLLLFIAFALPGFYATNAFAQHSKSGNKTSNPYRGSYQRFFTGVTSSSTFEIRDGALYAWGRNNYGQLGDGTTVDKSGPVQIGTDTKWTSIACGYLHTIALKSNGTLWAWGNNFNGRLGDGTTTDKTSPAQIGTDTKWVSIALGAYHTIGLKSDGTLWAWGLNNYGQLGDGTIINSSSYSCSNRICRQYTLVTAASTSYTQPLGGVANRTDFQAACVLAASVTPSGAAPVTANTVTQMTVQAFIDPSVQTFNGQYYVQRHYDILPITNPNAATATITLYFTQAEFTAYNTTVVAASATALKLPIGPADAAGIANLRVTQYHGIPLLGYAPANYPAIWLGSGPAHIAIDPADANIVWNARDSRWEVSFDVTGFSGFFIHAGANNIALPVKLLSFTAQKAGEQRNRISWATASETPGSIFNVERSDNGRSFVSIGEVAGKGTANEYSFYDEQPMNNINNYYRLKITEAGEKSYSNIVVLGSGGDQRGSVMVSPVPATDAVRVTSTDVLLIGTMAGVSDMHGREIYRFKLKGVGAIDIDVREWAAGIYMLKLAGGEVIRIVKQ